MIQPSKQELKEQEHPSNKNTVLLWNENQLSRSSWTVSHKSKPLKIKSGAQLSNPPIIDRLNYAILKDENEQKNKNFNGEWNQFIHLKPTKAAKNVEEITNGKVGVINQNHHSFLSWLLALLEHSTLRSKHNNEFGLNKTHIIISLLLHIDASLKRSRSTQTNWNSI